MTRVKKANQLHGGLKVYGILRNVTANCETGNFETGNCETRKWKIAKREIAKPLCKTGNCETKKCEVYGKFRGRLFKVGLALTLG